jgi:hypothetical protein
LGAGTSKFFHGRGTESRPSSYLFSPAMKVYLAKPAPLEVN